MSTATTPDPLADYYSDEATARRAADPTMRGLARAAGYLLEVPAEHRSNIAAEAHLATNMVGGLWADHVYSLAQRWYLYSGHCPECGALIRNMGLQWVDAKNVCHPRPRI